MTYLANCGGDCTKFDGSTGNAWFKIDEAGLADGKWASDKLIAGALAMLGPRLRCPDLACAFIDGSKWTVTIPSSIASGQYLLRHEILALHSASTLNGGQFYRKRFLSLIVVRADQVFFWQRAVTRSRSHRADLRNQPA